MYRLAVVSRAGGPECRLPRWVASIRDVYVLGANWRPFKVHLSQAGNQLGGFQVLAYEGVWAFSCSLLLNASAMQEPYTLTT
jgi:hypothetical protein